MQTPIDSLLRQQAQRGKIRFCMPGHKGMLADNDITEAGAMDNLLHPEGALLQARSPFWQRPMEPHKPGLAPAALRWAILRSSFPAPSRMI